MEREYRAMAKERLDLMEKLQAIKNMLRATLAAGMRIQDWGLAASRNMARTLWSK